MFLFGILMNPCWFLSLYNIHYICDDSIRWINPSFFMFRYLGRFSRFKNTKLSNFLKTLVKFRRGHNDNSRFIAFCCSTFSNKLYTVLRKIYRVFFSILFYILWSRSISYSFRYFSYFFSKTYKLYDYYLFREIYFFFKYSFL